MVKCKCGCGLEVKVGNFYLRGHSGGRIRKGQTNCLQCGIYLENSHSLFCSTKCHKDNVLFTKVSLWLNGKIKVLYNKVLKRILIKIYGYKCFNCGIVDWCKKILVLEIDHKNGNSDDISPNNVRLLCPNCHSQTDTYKGKNRGNGRFKRRQRMKEGKSY